MTLAALRIGNDVSYVSTINHDIHFAWQAQYLVRCEGDACCSAFNGVSYVSRINHDIHFAWQAQYLVKLQVTLAALGVGHDVSYVTRITDDSYFGWQAQYLVKLEGDSC